VWKSANKLGLIVGSEENPPELPYKPKREQGYLVMVFGCIVMGSISILAHEPSRSHLISTLMVITVNNHTTLIVPVWLKSVIGLSVIYFLLYHLGNGGRVILDRDFFRYHTYLKKHQMAYADIEQAEISKGYDGTYGARAFMDIYSRKNTTPIRINLGSISGADVAIILKVIHQQEPRAKMNEVAERIRKGEFPIS
jgi:hypothetical protein